MGHVHTNKMEPEASRTENQSVISKELAAVRQEVIQEINRRRDEFVDLCAQIVRHPTENPPGDTLALADFVTDWLKAQGIESEAVEPKPSLKSVLSTFNGDRSTGLHFMFNGHLDVFPAGDASQWAFSPFAGRIAEGRIQGRGVADMKGGLTASLIAYALLYRYRSVLPARISIMAVADEETGGLWGTDWILKSRPEWLPDACLIGEPCSPDAVRIGEKGISWLHLTISGRSYHGSLGAGENCILQMAEALLLLKEVTKLPARIPEELRAVIEKAKNHNLNEDTRDRGWLLERPSYNVGRIEGGMKVNISPQKVEADVDIRVPYGLTPQEILSWARSRLDQAGMKDARVDLFPFHSPANYTAPNHPLTRVVIDNAAEHYGQEPTITITTGGTDGRFFRQRGIPTIIYGPRPQGMAGLDEYITIDDFLAVLKVHACAAIDYMGRATKGRPVSPG